MRKLILTISLISLISASSRADDVVYLTKDTPSPYTGYLFPEEKAKLIRTQLIDLDELKYENASFQKSIDLYKKNEDLYSQKVNLLLDQNNKLVDTVYKEQQVSNLEKAMWFSIGVIATGLGVYVGKKVAQ